MKYLQSHILIVALACSVTLPAWPAEPDIQRLLVCKALANPSSRLACYDSAVARLAAMASQPQSRDEAGSRDHRASEVDAFGAPAPVERKRSSLDKLVAVVTAVARGTDGARVFTLDNGQVWAETRAAAIFPVGPGDRVTIRAGLLGSFRMVGEDGRATAVERKR